MDKRAGMGVAMADCMGAVQGQCDRRAYGSTKFGTRSSRPNQNRGFIRQVAAGGRLIVDKRMRCALLDLLPPCRGCSSEKRRFPPLPDQERKEQEQARRVGHH